MTDGQFVDIVKHMDKDGDGTITYQEFLAYFKRDIDASTVLQKISGISIKQAKDMVRMNLENKLPSGPGTYLASRHQRPPVAHKHFNQRPRPLVPLCSTFAKMLEGV
jgi:hypothetical protein|eukprot:SAG25_NODE_1629_length_2650_cov_1.095649_2_plen_107_part_00